MNKPADFAKISFAYRFRVWIAMLGLLLFVVLYVGLAGWFTYTTYRMIVGMTAGGKGAIAAFFVALPAGFLAVFMWKAIFFIRRGSDDPGIEITANEQPRLFAFLSSLADELRAPRPHRVFLAPGVNAAVFYDLSILNFLFPSRKNLTIGLGLINVLNRSEFTAVLAHEFGHFAQRSMAVGRWVYVGEQIAAHIIAKRDVLDRILNFLSSIDLRVAWIGWIMRTVVWSIRSVTETAFRWVAIADRALSREMEFQADLVAVSVTGSDALINALYRLQSADEDWERTLNFANEQLSKGKAVHDLFTVQTWIGEHLRRVLHEPQRGIVPGLISEEGLARRLFTEQIAQPPRMWATHPPNTEREENAKRVYIPARLDDESAWTLFNEPTALRVSVTRFLFKKVQFDKEPEPMPLEAARSALDKQFSHESFESNYQGVFLGRLVTIGIAEPEQLYGHSPDNVDIAKSLADLYPQSLHVLFTEWRGLKEEISLLEAINNDLYDASGGAIRYRGEVVRRADLSELISRVKRERDGIVSSIEEHDRRCRTVHAVAAKSIGHGWQCYLNSLARLLHYVEHSEADLNDAHGHLANATAMATATGRVSSRKLKRILNSANDLQGLMAKLDSQAETVELPPSILKDLEVEKWRDALNKLELPAANAQNISEWMKVVDSWVIAMKRSLDDLRKSALGELLKSEKYVARCFLGGEEPQPAPQIAKVPEHYSTRVRGTERERQKKLDWWSRFTLAEGKANGIARFTIALSIVAAVVIAGLLVGSVTLVIYNGLSTPVAVSVNGQEVAISPFQHQTLSIGSRGRCKVVTTTRDRRPIESFEERVNKAFAIYVYNIAGAAPMIEWTAVYGNTPEVKPDLLGCPRWRITTADHVFTNPPREIKTSGSGGSRTVLSSDSAAHPLQILQMIDLPAEQERVKRVHATWDAGDGRHILYWLQMASELDGFNEIVSHRLTCNPRDVSTLRIQQDSATPDTKNGILERHREEARQNPDDGDWQYIGIRAMPDSPEQDAAFMEGHRKWPDNAWLRNAAGFAFSRKADWQEALSCYQGVLGRGGPLFDTAAIQVARLRRLLANDNNPKLSDLQSSFEVNHLLTLESGEQLKGTPLHAYSLLNKGQVDEAYRVAGGNEADKHLLVLLAASSGAKEEWRQSALQIPVQDIKNPAFLLYLAALAFRNGQPTEHYLKEGEKRYREKLTSPVKLVKQLIEQGGPPESLEDQLTGLDLHDRGIVLSVAIVMNPTMAKQNWRKTAKALLFATERPAM